MQDWGKVLPLKKQNKKEWEKKMYDIDDQDNLHLKIVPLSRVFLFVIALIVSLAFSSILVCATDSQCRDKVPTLNNLLKSPMVMPFLITALNAVLGLHVFVSIGIYYMTQLKTPKWAKLVVLTSALTYISVVITLFVFPFTMWEKDYANYLIITFGSLWMLTIITCLKIHYHHSLFAKKYLYIWTLGCAGVYIVSSLVYFILRTGFPTELSGILVVEIFAGLAFFGFLILTLGHIWKMEIIIKI